MEEGWVEPRVVTALEVPSWGRVVPDQVLGWTLLGADGELVEAVKGFLIELAAAGCSTSTRRSYCYDLLRWWRFCAAVDVC